MLSGYDYLTGVGLSEGCYRQLNLVSQAVKAPAAGTDFSVQVPDAGAPWEIVAVRARLVTSATVANRFVSAVVTDNNGDEYYRAGFDTALVASTTYVLTFTPSVATVVGGVTNTKALTFPIPGGPYLPRYSVASVTAAIDTGDAYSQVRVWYAAVLPVPEEADEE